MARVLVAVLMVWVLVQCWVLMWRWVLTVGAEVQLGQVVGVCAGRGLWSQSWSMMSAEVLVGLSLNLGRGLRVQTGAGRQQPVGLLWV